MRVIARLNVGGPARHVAALAQLQSRGFDTLLVHGAVEESEASLEALVSGTGMRIVALPELGRRIAWRSDVSALRQLARLAREFDPDIVHTHTAKAGSLGRAAAAARGWATGRPRIVHTFHGHVFDGYFGPLGSSAVMWTERALARVSDRIVVISERQKRDIVQRFRIAPGRKVRVIPLGLDLAPLAAGGQRARFRRELGAESDDILVGIVGRLVPIKGHELFLRAGRRAFDRGLKGRLVIVGGGELDGELRSLARDLELGDRVHFLGWRDDLPDLYAGLDIVTLTSRNEGTPVALIEAMAAGRSVVSTDVGGVADVVQHDETGLLVRAGDESGLAEAWLQLAGDPDRRARLGSAAQADVQQRFSTARLLDDIESMYSELLEDRR